MITRIVNIDGDSFCCSADGNVIRCAEFYGLSTDTKPIEGVKNAETFYEMDTKRLFMFDEQNGKWLEQ